MTILQKDDKPSQNVPAFTRSILKAMGPAEIKIAEILQHAGRIVIVEDTQPAVVRP